MGDSRVGPGDFLLGTDTQDGQPVHLPAASRPSHLTVIGATGTGKTTLLQRLILADIENGTSCVAIDAHGDITRGVLGEAPASAKERVHLIEVWEDRPFGLNLFDLSYRSPRAIDKAASEILLIFKRMFEGDATFRPQLDNDLDLLIRTMLANEGCTLAEALYLIRDDPTLRDRMVSQVTNNALKDSWRDYAHSKDRNQRNAALRNRLNPFLGSETVRTITGQAQTTVPLKRVMDTPGETLLVNLPIGGRGSESESRFLGSLLVCLLTRLVFDRAGGEGPFNRVHLYLDEYGRYATPTTAKLFGEGRKYNFSLAVAHQSRDDLRGTGNEDAELQAACLICFHPTSGHDAVELAASMPVVPRSATEPRRAISLTPIKQLLQGRHQSDTTQHLTRKLLLPIQETIDGPVLASTYHQALAREGMSLIESLLVDVMKNAFPLRSREFYMRLAAATYPLRHHIGLSCGLGWMPDMWDQWGESLAQRIVEHDPKPLYDEALDARFYREYLEDRKDICNAQEMLDYRRKTVREHGEIGYPFFHDLYTLCDLLVSEPLYVSVPGHEARPPQTYADAQGELANNIKSLPNFHAYIRLRTPDGVQVREIRLGPTPEHTSLTSSISPETYMRLKDPNYKFGLAMDTVTIDFATYFSDLRRRASAKRESTDAVRARSRERFGRPREQVEQEIRRRQTLFAGGRTNQADVAKQQPDAPAVDLAQATARAKWKREHPTQVEDAPKQSPQPRPTIGRRSPKRLAAPSEEQKAVQHPDPAPPPKNLPSSEAAPLRVYEVAKELGVESKVVMETLASLGIFVRSASSLLTSADRCRVMETFRP
ncbi:translation initiation factor IF-2 N-terminal domain-containing protein [Streptomyces sp. NPDC001581]|uniref:translation initiation factor IF-2 N-terminal domain-containing protein n=1 Tax=Streptomyces sp. NPDC001581 TaxID=3154386 RepID=UPI00331BD7EA